MKYLTITFVLLSLFFNVNSYAELSWDEINKAVIEHYENDSGVKNEISRLKNIGFSDDGIETTWVGGDCEEGERLTLF